MANKSSSKPENSGSDLSKKRVKRLASYKSFKLANKVKPAGFKQLPGVFRLLRMSLGIVRNNKALFGGIIVIHSILSLVFVAGLSSSFDFVEAKKQLDELLGGQVSGAMTATTLMSYLFASTSAQSGDVAGTYQIFLVLMTSLAVIWSVREVMARHKVSAKDAYYRGIYPLVPLILVFFVIGLQLLPVVIGSTIYGIIVAGGLAINSLEKILWLIFFLLSALLSFYMILSSIFAAYIVTLPGMTPMKALRSARGLVMHRRTSVGIRVLAFPILYVFVALIILLPIVFFVPWLAVVTALFLGSCFICLWNTYMYLLYREML